MRERVVSLASAKQDTAELRKFTLIECIGAPNTSGYRLKILKLEGRKD